MIIYHFSFYSSNSDEKFFLSRFLILIFRIRVFLHRWTRQTQIQSFSTMTASLLYFLLTLLLHFADNFRNFALPLYCELSLFYNKMKSFMESHFINIKKHRILNNKIFFFILFPSKIIIPYLVPFPRDRT